jgi:hypothetical protein
MDRVVLRLQVQVDIDRPNAKVYSSHRMWCRNMSRGVHNVCNTCMVVVMLYTYGVIATIDRTCVVCALYERNHVRGKEGTIPYRQT